MNNDTLVEYRRRRSLIDGMNYRDATPRLHGFLVWLDSNEITSAILHEISSPHKIETMLKLSNFHEPPPASSPEEIAMLGLHFMRESASGREISMLAIEHGIRPSFETTSLQDIFDNLDKGFLQPALDYIEDRLRKSYSRDMQPVVNMTMYSGSIISESDGYLSEIQVGLHKFQQDNNGFKTAFIMMQFGTTEAHANIVRSIKETLSKHDIIAFRADDKQYHNNLLRNVLTYIYGCDIGIAVFERIEAEHHNPNVSFEVGYMKALNKQVCLLKDQTMKTLPTDLLGELYKDFDPRSPESSIPGELEKWLKDKGL